MTTRTAVRGQVATMEFICVCVRVPKSGSASLGHAVRTGFAGRRVFYLPSTITRDAAFSHFQRYRAFRSRAQNLFKHYGTISLNRVYETIAREAADGDAIDGGHIDFRTVAVNIPRRLKIVTILRRPEARSLSDYNYNRQGYFKKPFFNRYDAGILHKASARYSYVGYLDFLLDHREIYGNIASAQLGWDGTENLGTFSSTNIFHAGVLEKWDRFATGFSEKLGRPLHFPHENRTNMVTAREIGAEARSKIERLYERDFVLYEWVRDNF